MVFRKLASFIYNFIGLRRQLCIKDVTSLRGTTTLDVSENAKEDAVKSLEELKSSASTQFKIEGEFCCVCLSVLKRGEELRNLPCSHVFHKVCIDRWFNLCRKTCPVCRFEMGEEERLYRREEQFTEEMAIWFSSFHAAGF